MQKGTSVLLKVGRISHTLPLWKDSLCSNKTSFFLFPKLRPYTAIMSGVSGGTELERLKARAELTDQILADLRAKISAIKQAAVQEANSREAERLQTGISHYLSEIEKLKKALIVAEIGNGVRQVLLPTKAELAAFSAKAEEPPVAPVPKVVNGETTAATPDSSKGKKEGGKKSKPADKQADTGGKKAKSDKSAKGDGEENAKPKKSGAAPGGGKGGGEAAEAPVDISRLDMRVGKIVAVDRHPDADSLYVEQVDVGEGRHRTIISGLVKHVPISAMKDRIAVFMCNLKPAKMRGILSEGMIMCASSPDKVEILVPPTDSAIGDRVTVDQYPGTPDAQLNPKKKVWETLKPDVRTDANRVASYKGAPFKIEGKGFVVAPTLADTQIS